MNTLNFLCIKWGTKYSSEYVNKLYRGVKNNTSTPIRFVCLTDNSNGLDGMIEDYPLPETGFDEGAMDAKKGGETWRKIGLFKAGIADLSGDTLFLDLDVIITGSLDEMFEYKKGEFIVIQDWLEKKRGNILPWRNSKVANTSLFRFNPAKHSGIFEDFKYNQSSIMANFRIEQQYVSWYFEAEINFWNENWVHSFKRSCRAFFPFNHFLKPKLPTGIKVLVFHGHPLPNEAISGYKKGLFKTILPAPWIAQFWK